MKTANAGELYKKKIEKLRRTLPELYARISEKLQEEMLAETIERTPGDEGDLRDSWAAMPIEKSGTKYMIKITNPKEYAAYVEFGYMQRPGMILKMKEVKGKLRFVKFLGYSAKYGLGDPTGKVPTDEDGNVVIVTRKRFIKGHFMARDALDVMKEKWSNNYKRRILKAMQEAFK